MNKDQDKPSLEAEDEEQDVARLLRAVGKRAAMPEHLRHSWEATFRQELAQVRAQRARRRVQRWAYSACALVIVGLGLALLGLPGQNNLAPAVARVVTLAGEHVVQLNAEQLNAGQVAAGGETGSLVPGQALPLPNTLSTGVASRLALSYRDYDIRLHSQTRLRLEPDKLVLLAGTIYVSDDGGNSATGLLVATPFGEVRDVGTQFSLSLEPEQMVARVRRGAIALAAGRNQYRADASAGGARQLVINQASEVAVTAIPPSGDAWQWIYQSGPGFSLDGNSAFGFLRWVARESGLQLVFTSDSAEIYAHTTILHGDINDFDPLKALSPVLASTDLQIEMLDQQQLQVTLARR